MQIKKNTSVIEQHDGSRVYAVVEANIDEEEKEAEITITLHKYWTGYLVYLPREDKEIKIDLSTWLKLKKEIDKVTKKIEELSIAIIEKL